VACVTQLEWLQQFGFHALYMCNHHNVWRDSPKSSNIPSIIATKGLDFLCFNGRCKGLIGFLYSSIYPLRNGKIYFTLLNLVISLFKFFIFLVIYIYNVICIMCLHVIGLGFCICVLCARNT
jgi:hypothetical protein